MQEVIELLEKMGIPAILVTLIGMVVKFKPITFVSSNHLERKLSSKELRFSYVITIYIIQGLFYFFIIATLSSASYKWLWPDQFRFLFYILAIPLSIAFCYLYIIEDRGERYTPSSSWKINVIRLILSLLYLFGWLVIYTIYFGRTAFLVYYRNDHSLKFEQLITIYIIILISSMLLPLMFKPLFSYLKVGMDKEFKVNLEESDWYLISPISKGEFLLGDSPNYNDSKKFKIVKREILFDKHFVVVDKSKDSK